ncbi:acyl-CoA dehydrogenase/oxidase [Paraphysoderma sedebokerense]|nr:acyl-CoA dehydrogenase/oxidase [Paraphysoderma sedebokerense]
MSKQTPKDFIASYKPGPTRLQTAQDLQTARSLATFPSDKLTRQIFQSEEFIQQRKKIVEIVLKDPVFRRDDRYQGSREQRLLRALEMSKRMIEIRDELNLSEFEMVLFRTVVDETIPISLHEGMFLPVLRTQTSPEQYKQWVPLAQQYKIIGSYAQTELAHGSNLSGLETTATYIKETDEFEINSPDITASKWWVGSLGIISTHTIVQAKLIIDGRDYGPHPFIVPVRSMEDHKPLPGVIVGDIGPKFGFNLIDNGFLMFKQHRIPRTNMLMKFAKVTPQGEYVKPPHPKLAFGGMVFVRTYMNRVASFSLARASTIATRYCAVRRQFNVTSSHKISVGLSSSEETPVIMYPSVQYRVFPRIAESYAILFASQHIEHLYTDMLGRLNKFDVSTLPTVHATSSALKSYCTGLAADGIEELRRACGGHGFMMSSGFPYLFANYVPAVTYEGENVLLTQQTSRYLLKQLNKYHRNGLEQLTPLTQYIEITPEQLRTSNSQVKEQNDWHDPQHQLAALAHRACRLLHVLAAKASSGTAFADLNVECARLSVAHSQFILVQCFHAKLHQIQKSDPSVYPVMKLVNDVFAMHSIEKCMGDFTEDGYLNYDQATWLREALKQSLGDMLKDAVALVDAWDFSDYELDSTLGRSDGKVYEALFERALADPVNQGQNGKAIALGYEQYIKPLLKGERTKKSSVDKAITGKSKL